MCYEKSVQNGQLKSGVFFRNDLTQVDTVDGGRNPVRSPVEVGSLLSLSHYLQGVHRRWLFSPDF